MNTGKIKRYILLYPFWQRHLFLQNSYLELFESVSHQTEDKSLSEGENRSLPVLRLNAWLDFCCLLLHRGFFLSLSLSVKTCQHKHVFEAALGNTRYHFFFFFFLQS